MVEWTRAISPILLFRTDNVSNHWYFTALDTDVICAWHDSHWAPANVSSNQQWVTIRRTCEHDAKVRLSLSGGPPTSSPGPSETVQLPGTTHIIRHIYRSVWPTTQNLSLEIHGAILLDILFTYTQYSLFLTEVGYSLFLKLKSKTLSIHFFLF